MQNVELEEIKVLTHQLLLKLDSFNKKSEFIASMSQWMPDDLYGEYVIDVMNQKFEYISVNDFNSSSKVEGIRAIREVTRMGLKESVDFMNNLLSTKKSKTLKLVSGDYISARNVLKNAGFSIDD